MRRPKVKNAEFRTLTIAEVRERADAEPPAEADKPEYFGRPWSQLRDEMGDAETVGELPNDRVEVFFHSTGSVYAEGEDLLRLLGGNEPENE